MHDDSPQERSKLPLSARSPAAALTVSFAVIAIIAIGVAAYFWREQQATLTRLAAARAQASRAEENFKAGEGTLDALVSNLADSFSSRTDIQGDEIVAMLGRTESAVGALAAKTNGDPDVRRSQASMYVQFSRTFLALGDASGPSKARKKVRRFSAHWLPPIPITISCKVTSV